MFSLSIALWFITLCLLVLFFAQVVFKAKAKYEPHKYKRPLRAIIILAILTFLAVNITSAVLAHEQRSVPGMTIFKIIQIRVVINDSLFVVAGVSLAVCIYSMTKMSATNLVLEAKGTTTCQASVACVLIVLLYTSRAIYNLIVVFLGPSCNLPNFGYDWVNVSDQADFVNLDDRYNFATFGIVLFIWELMPTFVVIAFFRVQRPTQSMTTLNDMSSRTYNPRAYFFDNPRRYDSDDDLTRSGNSRQSLIGHSSEYGINNSGSGSMPRSFGTHQYGIPGTTPPLLFTAHSNNSQTYNHINGYQQNYYDGT
ncbi:unnamed protein product [Owenia fusiformis]|uniref:Uncharacterized protein n=1 Tax=Owenia fusiformis TaxID=6347 RepID=A0A8S4PBY8_OWEFU|nr:unnamed protein product [Owenia fusiformis]